MNVVSFNNPIFRPIIRDKMEHVFMLNLEKG